MTKKKTTSKEAPVEEAQVIEFEDEKQLSTIPETSMVASSNSPMALIEKALASDAGVETLERLWELQIKFEENEAKKAYFKAVAGFKTESISILKTKQVRFETQKGVTEYKHAELGEIVETVIPLLGKHGLSHRWSYKQEQGKIEVSCILTHELGYSESVSLEAGKDDSGGKNAIQAVISTKTYLERHTVLGITGLAAKGVDDDARSSETIAEDVITEQQGMDIIEKIEAAGETEERFCKYFKIANVWLLPVQKLEHATATLDKKIDAKEKQS